MDKTQQDAISSNEESDAEFAEYYAEGNAILNRMKKAIFNNKGIRLSAEEMQFIATMQIGGRFIQYFADFG